MRLLHLIMTALAAAFAVVAGLVVAALVALVGSAFVIFKRIKRPGVAPATSRRPTSLRRDGDVIDITATEVATERVGPPRS